MLTKVEELFHEAMLEIYRRAKKEADYNATRFLTMVSDLGGLQAATQLIHSNQVSDGYTALWQKQRLDLSVEALILRPEWDSLFTDDERAIATKRLADYGWKP